ncbi:hypothetical protein [Alteromonas lipolytica]|uniref:Uncharacterized protein n=1 Tax=Alteromonas lipolytica TaxID=1856405 RepID=A0A1E8FDT9_9ALTE|nr:hypothetical protein [Alteromonas lipolytica]OFI33926.1 hypothetical protein BFC17_20390 [Alteromonas lipolytica]GGF67195.1 hypothetical protein GCM10011338_19230 [Alteromonas lipolytica]
MTKTLHSFTVSKILDELSRLFVDHEYEIDELRLEDDQQSCDLLLSILLRQCADDSRERYPFLKDLSGLLCSHDLFKTELKFQDLEYLNLVYDDEQNQINDPEELLRS